MSEKIKYEMDFAKCKTPRKHRSDGYMVGSWACKHNCRYCDNYTNRYVVCSYNKEGI